MTPRPFGSKALAVLPVCTASGTGGRPVPALRIQASVPKTALYGSRSGRCLSISVASAFGRLRLPKDKALFGRVQVVVAEFTDGHGAARPVLRRGRILPTPRPGALRARWRPSRASAPGAQGQLSRPTGRISVLHNPCTSARWLHPKGEAGKVAVPIQGVAGDRL